MPWRNTAGIGSGGRAPAVQEASRHTMQDVGHRRTMRPQNLPQGWDHGTMNRSMAGEGPETGWLSIRVPPGDVAARAAMADLHSEDDID